MVDAATARISITGTQKLFALLRSARAQKPSTLVVVQMRMPAQAERQMLEDLAVQPMFEDLKVLPQNAIKRKLRVAATPSVATPGATTPGATAPKVAAPSAKPSANINAFDEEEDSVPLTWVPARAAVPAAVPASAPAPIQSAGQKLSRLVGIRVSGKRHYSGDQRIHMTTNLMKHIIAKETHAGGDVGAHLKEISTKVVPVVIRDCDHAKTADEKSQCKDELVDLLAIFANVPGFDRDYIRLNHRLGKLQQTSQTADPAGQWVGKPLRND